MNLNFSENLTPEEERVVLAGKSKKQNIQRLRLHYDLSILCPHHGFTYLTPIVLVTIRQANNLAYTRYLSLTKLVSP